MAFQYLENELRRRRHVPFARIVADAHELYRRVSGKEDIPLPEGAPATIFISSEPLIEVFSTREDVARKLVKKINAYKDVWNKDTLTPGLVTETWGAFWNALSTNAGLDQGLPVPACDRTKEELAELRKKNRAVIFMPDEIMAKDGINMLARIMPEVAKDLLAKQIVNSSDKGGWLDVEMRVRPPYKNRTAYEVMELFAKEGREGQRIQTYIIASKFRELLDGHYFDQVDTENHRTQTILLGSVVDWYHRAPLEILRKNDGSLRIDTGPWTKKQSYVGFRSEGRKKAD